jgi:hypothetical protein
MAEQMRVDRADPELAAVISAMKRPEFFDAVQKAVRDRCGQ